MKMSTYRENSICATGEMRRVYGKAHKNDAQDRAEESSNLHEEQVISHFEELRINESSVSNHVEEFTCPFDRKLNLNNRLFQIQENEQFIDDYSTIGGGFLYSHHIDHRGMCHITVVHEPDGYEYDDSSWFKYTHYFEGLLVFKKLCRARGATEFTLHCLSSYMVKIKNDNYDYISHIKEDTRRNSHRYNTKEQKRKQYKILKNKHKNYKIAKNYKNDKNEKENKNNKIEENHKNINREEIEPHSDWEPDEFEIPQLHIVPRYPWRSQRPRMDELYESFMQMRVVLQPAIPRSTDARELFDLLDVWNTRLRAHFHNRTLSTMPGPPIEEQLLCEIIVVAQDAPDNMVMSILGWMVHHFMLPQRLVTYLSYWYYHYLIHVPFDQICSIAFPRSEPHSGFCEPDADEQRAYDEWLCQDADIDQSEALRGSDDADCDSFGSKSDQDDPFFGVKEIFTECKTTFKELPGSTDQDIDKWMGHVESMVILGRQLYKAQDFEDCLLSAIAYVKIYCTNQSMILQLREVSTWCDTQPENIEPHSYGQSIVDGWNLCRSNKNFRRVSYLISAALSMSICSIKEINWSFAGFKVLSIEAAKEQLDAVDLIDSIVKTFTWIATCGYRIFIEGDIRSVLYDDQRMASFLNNCDYVLAHADTATAGNLPEDNEFRHKVEKALSDVIDLKKAQNGGPSTLWLQRKYHDLVNIKQKLIAKSKNTAIRFAPIGFSISGPTGIGKSTLANLTMKTSLQAMGFDSAEDRLTTYDNDDQYQSGYTTDINGMFMDDFGNTRSTFVEKAPTAHVIKFFNNVAAQAVKAEIQDKGVVFINFKCGVITTNIKDLDARQYSNCPESILRRFYHVTATVLPEYTRDGALLNNFHPELQNADITKNVWSINIEEVITGPSSKPQLGKKVDVQSAYTFKVLVLPWFDGKEKFECKNLDVKTYLKVVVFLSKRHVTSQNGVVERIKSMHEMKFCPKCSMFVQLCDCIEPHSFELISDLVVGTFSDVFMSYWKRFLKPVYVLEWLLGWRCVREWQTKELERELHRMMDSYCIPTFLALIPESVYSLSLVQKCIRSWEYGAASLSVPLILSRTICFYIMFMIIVMSCGVSSKLLLILSFCFFLLTVFFITLGWRSRFLAIHHEFCTRRDALPVHIKHSRDKYLPGIACLVLGVAIVKIWNAYRKQSLNNKLLPNSLINPEVIDEKPSWQGYFKNLFGGKVKGSIFASTATLDQIGHTLEKNIFFCDFYRDDSTKTRCNIIFPRKCVALFPLHLFFDEGNMTSKRYDTLKLKITRKPGLTSTVFHSMVSFDQVYVFEHMDLVMAYIPNCPDIKDMSKWLPLENPQGNMLARFLVRDEACNLHSERVYAHMESTGHRYRNFYGGYYKTKLAERGACMGVLISETKPSCILGMHIGGAPGQNHGIMQTLTLSSYDDALQHLSKMPGVLLSSHAVEIPEQQYNVPIIASKDIHPNAKFIHFLDNEAYVDVYGSTKLRSSMKSSVHQSYISTKVSEVIGVPNKWGPPKLEPNWRAFNASLDYIVHPALMHVPQHLERARQDWIKPLIEKIIVQHEQFGIKPLSSREMVLGRPGVRFLDAIPMSTSMGFPLYGQKNKYFTEVRHNEELIDRIPDELIVAEMRRLMNCWRRGERGYPVVSATLKDEPTLKTKEKVRVFEAIAVAFGLYVRKYFLPIARFLSLNPLLSESAVGVNSFSPDWDELMTYTEQFDKDMLMGWDYSKYDLRMNSQMTRAVLLSYIELAKHANYDVESLYIMEQMVNDIVHPLMDYNGTLLMVYNMNTSGNNITVNINSTANSLYVRMCFFDLYPDVDNFRAHCALMTYGDDGIASVHPDFRDFNIASFIAYMKKHDMKVTLPTKDDRENVRFLPIGELDFLKRQSFYIPEIGIRIGRLDEDSIFKSLHCNLKSKVCTDLEVSIATIESAMHEWFAFGREHYEKRREQMQRICIELNIPVHHAFVPFDERVVDWLQKYRTTRLDIYPQSDDYSSGVSCFWLGENFKDQSVITQTPLRLRSLIKIPEQNKEIESICNTKSCSERLWKLEQFLEVDASTYFRYATYSCICTFGLLFAAMFYKEEKFMACDIEPQSDEVQQYTQMPAPDLQKVHNVVFEDARPGYMEIKDGSIDSLREAPLLQDASLQDFFSRPLKIASYRWGVGTSFFEDLDPWSAYFNNPRVVNRISNFKLMHARLHVKIIINGTPFHYGRLLASYTPLPLTDQLTRNVALIPVDLVAASQRPHIYINPTSSIGGEMLLPFFLPQNVLDISFNDWRLLGELNIRSMQNLKHANGAVDTVTVSVFAWAEDVKMAVPTQIEPGSILPQADEYGDSPISKIASATAAMMRPLMMIPTIAPFARATEIGALAVSNIAKLYGYAKTPLINYGVMLTNSTKYQWAPTDVPDYVNKLTVDSKQEISIDPRTTGLDATDEMALLNVVKRESFLYSFPWEIGDLEESLLFSVVVDPCIFRSYDNGTNREIHMPACCYGAFPFAYWRGSMKYRFQVVCSNFHRGRLKIVYDPTTGSANSEYNVAYTTIIDISDKTDFTIDVGWGQPYTFKQHIDFVSQSVNEVIGTGTLPYLNSSAYGNGVLSVYVVNELTVPVTTINNDISINVFVSACDDFEVAAPDMNRVKRLRVRPPPSAPGFADIEPQSEEVVPEEDSKPTDPETISIMAKSITTYDATDKVHFGERILSFRQLVKRYDWFESFSWLNAANSNNFMYCALRRNMFPYFPGWYPSNYDSITSAVDGGNYAYSNFTWLHYVTCAYAGWKGGTRYMVDAVLNNSQTTLSAYRTPRGAPVKAVSVYPTNLTANQYTVAEATFNDNFVNAGQGGAIYVNGSSLNYEVPFYSINRFIPARNYVQYATDDPFEEKHVLVSTSMNPSTPMNRQIRIYTAGAEDFSTYFFLGAPVFYYEESRPAV